MKQYWLKISTKIDALSLRERTIIFTLASLVLVTITNMLLLDPLFARQKALSVSLKADQAKIAAIRQQIQDMVASRANDPDAANRKRLQQLTEQSSHAQASLQEIQKSLVSPDKMAGLLEDILRRNGNLRLVSLKTLPPTSVNGTGEEAGADLKTAVQPAQNNKAPASGPSAGLVYRHGVEITVQGSYLDMVDYVTALESMPSQVFWGKAVLNADDHAKATLSLTLFTLSLDKRWLNI
jgi:MSHA biogenesis protein MshJ